MSLSNSEKQARYRERAASQNMKRIHIMLCGRARDDLDKLAEARRMTKRHLLEELITREAQCLA